MKLTHSDFDDARVVRVCEPRIDAACAIQFKDEMRALAEDGPERVILNLEDVTFLDSSGLGAVVGVFKALAEDQSLELAALTPAVERVFRLTRMDTIFNIHETADTAVSGPADGD